MKKQVCLEWAVSPQWPICICLLLFFSRSLYGQTGKFSVSAGGIMETTDLKWSIAGNQEGNSPNILSELSFRNIITLGPYLQVEYAPFKKLKVTGYFSTAGTVSGKGTDADYQDDNRQNAVFNHDFRSNRGKTNKLYTHVAYSIYATDRIEVIPRLSFLTTSQSFRLLTSDFSDLNSTYKVAYNSAEMSIRFNYHFLQNIILNTDLGYGILKYNSEADWNLIEQFMHPVSFRQHANGYDISGVMGLKYHLFSNFDLQLSGSVSRINTNDGQDISYLQNGTRLYTRFNGANLTTYGLQLGSVLAF